MSPVDSTDWSPQIAPELVWRILENGTVLISPYVGEVYILHQMDTIIWQLLVEQKELAEIEMALVRKFNLSLEQARSHLQKFLHGLTKQGVLVWLPTSS
jgi:hypothetical protein